VASFSTNTNSFLIWVQKVGICSLWPTGPHHQQLCCGCSALLSLHKVQITAPKATALCMAAAVEAALLQEMQPCLRGLTLCRGRTGSPAIRGLLHLTQAAQPALLATVLRSSRQGAPSGGPRHSATATELPQEEPGQAAAVGLSTQGRDCLPGASSTPSIGGPPAATRACFGPTRGTPSDGWRPSAHSQAERADKSTREIHVKTLGGGVGGRNLPGESTRRNSSPTPS